MKGIIKKKNSLKKADLKEKTFNASRRGIVGKEFPTILPDVWKYENRVLRYTKRNRNIEQTRHTDPNVI